MIFEQPDPSQLEQLVQLWKEAFGEYDGFWELFLEQKVPSPQKMMLKLPSKQLTPLQ